MSDKAKFHNMTKPIRFRRIKMVKQRFVLWCKALRERIKYLINNILYKLHILKRFTFNDNIFLYKDVSSYLKFEEIKTPNFIAVVHVRLKEEHLMDYDYFYKETKKGIKKTLVLKDFDEYRTFADAHLERIQINIGNNTWYYVDSLPVFKMFVPEDFKPVTFIDGDAPIEKVEFKTIEYDIMKLKGLRHAQFLGTKEANLITRGELEYSYHISCKNFEDYLKNLELKDLIIGGR